jgi:hypothetical protein
LSKFDRASVVRNVIVDPVVRSVAIGLGYSEREGFSRAEDLS